MTGTGHKGAKRHAYDKYLCIRAGGVWWVRPPCATHHGITPRSAWREFTSWREAILYVKAHLRMDAMGVPRG